MSVLDDVRKLEPYSRSWTMKWNYEISKDEVANRLTKDLSFLKLSLKDHPDNTELLLLTGLVARYAYNLDVEGTYDTSLRVLGQAEKLVPTDFRAGWFRATLLCQTTQPKAGADEFLSIEDGNTWEHLPVAFWDDYIECASVTNMPAHVLRAAGHIKELRAPDSPMRTFLIGTAHKRIDPFDPAKDYDPKEVWYGDNSGSETKFTSTTCGIRMQAGGNWTVDRLEVTKGSCVAYFSTGPYKATTRSLSPSILLLVQRPKENETLQDFAVKFAKRGIPEPDTPARCPASECIAMKLIDSSMYGNDGDGHARVVAFQRDEPAFPGLLFESPQGPPKQDGKEGAEFFRPTQEKQRIPGKLYYLVLLDVAASIEEPAMKDFEFFIKNLNVE